MGNYKFKPAKTYTLKREKRISYTITKHNENGYIVREFRNSKVYHWFAQHSSIELCEAAVSKRKAHIMEIWKDCADKIVFLD